MKYHGGGISHSAGGADNPSSIFWGDMAGDVTNWRYCLMQKLPLAAQSLDYLLFGYINHISLLIVQIRLQRYLPSDRGC